MTTLTLTIEDTTEVKYGDVNGDGNRDRTFVICMFFCVTLTTMGIILGATDMWYNPRIQWNTLDGLESLTAIGYLTFCTMPMVMELWTQYRFYAERKRGAWNDATGQRVF